MRLSSIVYILLNSSSHTLGTVSTTSEPPITLGRAYSVVSGNLIGRSSTSRGSSQHMLRSSSEGLGTGQLSPPSISPGGSRAVPSDSLLVSEDEERPSLLDPVLPFGVYGDVFGADDALRQRLTRPSNSRIVIVPPGGSAARSQAIVHDSSASLSGGSSTTSLSVDPIEDQIEADIRVARSMPRGRHNPLAEEDRFIQQLANDIDRNRHEVAAPALGVPGPDDDADPFNSETVPSVGKLTLRRLMGQGETSTVFTVVESTDYVIKYQTDCPNAPNQDIYHPLLLDYYFHKKVERLGITPRVEAISPSEFTPEKPGMKCAFGMSREVYTRCRNDGLGTVRYMVMSRTGESIADAMRRYPNRQLPFSAAIRLGTQLMDMLRRLHTEAGVVHGDIHFGNVVFSDRSTDNLMLIDFGRSFSIPSGVTGSSVTQSAASLISMTSGISPSVLSSSPPLSLGGFRTPPTAPVSPPERISSAFEWTSYQMSPWEIAGYRPAPRDDAFKALMVMSFMIHGDAVLGYLKELDRNSTNTNSTSAARLDFVKTAYRYKMYEDMLVVPGGRHDVLQVKEDMGRINREQRLRISQAFNNVATHIRKLGINNMPNYEYIIDQLVTIQAIYRDHVSLATAVPSSLTGSGLWTRNPCCNSTTTTTDAPTTR